MADSDIAGDGVDWHMPSTAEIGMAGAGGSESIAGARTEIGQPLVMSGEVGVRYMVEEQRQAKGGGELVAKFHALAEGDYA